jgi:hypothetical protein
MASPQPWHLAYLNCSVSAAALRGRIPSGRSELRICHSPGLGFVLNQDEAGIDRIAGGCVIVPGRSTVAAHHCTRAKRIGKPALVCPIEGATPLRLPTSAAIPWGPGASPCIERNVCRPSRAGSPPEARLQLPLLHCALHHMARILLHGKGVAGCLESGRRLPKRPDSGRDGMCETRSEVEQKKQVKSLDYEDIILQTRFA